MITGAGLLTGPLLDVAAGSTVTLSTDVDALTVNPTSPGQAVTINEGGSINVNASDLAGSSLEVQRAARALN